MWSLLSKLPVRRPGWRRRPTAVSSSPIAVVQTSGIHLGTEGLLGLAWDTSEVLTLDALAPTEVK